MGVLVIGSYRMVFNVICVHVHHKEEVELRQGGLFTEIRKCDMDVGRTFGALSLDGEVGAEVAGVAHYCEGFSENCDLKWRRGESTYGRARMRFRVRHSGPGLPGVRW